MVVFGSSVSPEALVHSLVRPSPVVVNGLTARLLLRWVKTLINVIFTCKIYFLWHVWLNALLVLSGCLLAVMTPYESEMDLALELATVLSISCVVRVHCTRIILFNVTVCSPHYLAQGEKRTFTVCCAHRSTSLLRTPLVMSQTRAICRCSA